MSKWWYVDGMKKSTIHLPDDVADRLKKAAERERRSVHAQMLVYIKRGLDQDRDQMTGSERAAER